jgi:hypothetical protein
MDSSNDSKVSEQSNNEESRYLDVPDDIRYLRLHYLIVRRLIRMSHFSRVLLLCPELLQDHC